jgi:hypothetical protein
MRVTINDRALARKDSNFGYRARPPPRMPSRRRVTDPNRPLGLIADPSVHAPPNRPSSPVRVRGLAQGETGQSITSSARASKDCGTVRPSALAVVRLITSSNFVGRLTGKSAGFAPLRM